MPCCWAEVSMADTPAGGAWTPRRQRSPEGGSVAAGRTPRGAGRPPVRLDFEHEAGSALRAASAGVTPRGPRRGRPGGPRGGARGPPVSGAGHGAVRGGARCRAAAGTRGSAPQKGSPRRRERALCTTAPAEVPSVRPVSQWVPVPRAAVGCGAAAPAPAEAAPALGGPTCRHYEPDSREPPRPAERREQHTALGAGHLRRPPESKSGGAGTPRFAGGGRWQPPSLLSPRAGPPQLFPNSFLSSRLFLLLLLSPCKVKSPSSPVSSTSGAQRRKRWGERKTLPSLRRGAYRTAAQLRAGGHPGKGCGGPGSSSAAVPDCWRSGRCNPGAAAVTGTGCDTR